MCAHAHVYTDVYKHAPSCVYMYIHVPTRARVCTQLHMWCSHMYVHVCPHCVCVHMYTHVHTRVRVCTQLHMWCSHMHVCTYARTHTHAYVYTCTCMHMCIVCMCVQVCVHVCVSLGPGLTLTCAQKSLQWKHLLGRREPHWQGGRCGSEVTPSVLARLPAWGPSTWGPQRAGAHLRVWSKPTAREVGGSSSSSSS